VFTFTYPPFLIPHPVHPLILNFAYKWANWALLLYECKFAQPPADACSLPLTHAAKYPKDAEDAVVSLSVSVTYLHTVGEI